MNPQVLDHFFETEPFIEQQIQALYITLHHADHESHLQAPGKGLPAQLLFYFFCMIRCLFLLFLFFHTTLWCTAQAIVPLNEQAYTDSLNKVAATAQADSTKARVNFLLSDYWRAKDTVKSKTYLEQGRIQASRYPRLAALYYFYEAQFYFNRDLSRSAALFLKAEKALEPFADKETYLFRSMCWFDYGIMVRNEKGDAFVIDTWLNKAIPLAEQSGNDEKLAHYYTQLATIFMYNSQFGKAEIYNDKAIQLLEPKHPGSPTLLFAYLSATSNDIYNKKTARAKEMLDKAKQLISPYPESINYPNYYYNEALYYTAADQFDKALASLDKGIPMAKKYNQVMLLQMLVFRKYNILVEQKKYAPAKQLLMGILEEGTLSADPSSRKSIYQQLSTTNAGMGLMGEAYKWAVKYYQLSDSLHESKLQNNIQELEIKYRNAENEKKIAILQAEKDKVQLSAKNQRLINWLLGSSSLFLLGAAIFTFFYYRNNKKLAAQKELTYQQQLKEAEQQRQIQISEAMLQGEEQERERVARDLHDGLGGMLAGMKINLSALLAEEQKPAEKDLHRIVDQLDYSATELRRIVRNMMPEALLRFGLETALKELCEAMTTEFTRIDFQPFGISPSLPKQTQVAIYRVVQELLSNALRHSGASNIILQCTQNNHTFFITVEDDGKGFDTQAANQATGTGLNNIKKRVDYLKGHVAIETALNEGTTVNIELHVAG